jgi:hypothetical protein
VRFRCTKSEYLGPPSIFVGPESAFEETGSVACIKMELSELSDVEGDIEVDG